MNEDRNYMGSVSQKLHLMLFGGAAAAYSIRGICACKCDTKMRAHILTKVMCDVTIITTQQQIHIFACAHNITYRLHASMHS